MVERFGHAERLTADIDRAVATTLGELGRYDEAEDALRASLARYLELEGERSVRAFHVKAELAGMHFDRGDFEAAFDIGARAREAGVAVLGADHPAVVGHTLALAEFMQALGRFDEARDLVEELRERWRRGEAVAIFDRYEGMFPPLEQTEQVKGRVVDARGAPVAGAEVVVGVEVIGDGKYSHAHYSPRDRASGTQRLRTDTDGRFAAEDVPPTALVVAEHPEGGVSSPTPISARGESPELVVELLPTGRIEGALALRGTVPAKVSVNVRPMIETEGRSRHARQLVLRQGPFSIERLPPGRYALRVIPVRATSIVGGTETYEVDVTAGETTRLDVALDLRGPTLLVDVVGPGRTPVPSAEVLLLRGRRDFDSQHEIQRAVFATPEVFLQAAYASPTRTAELVGASLGEHTICVLPMPLDFKVMQVTAARERTNFPAHCEPIDVKAEPSERSLSIEVPSIPSLD